MSDDRREILLVEDSPGDVLLVREALASLGTPNNVHVVGDGASAVRFLAREGDYSDKPLPDMILLDLNLPIMDGRDVLREVKSHPDWKTIPVAVLSTSDSEEDIQASYDLAANCYIVKPMSLDGFRKVIEAVESFWLSVVKFPPKH